MECFEEQQIQNELRKQIVDLTCELGRAVGGRNIALERIAALQNKCDKLKAELGKCEQECNDAEERCNRALARVKELEADLKSVLSLVPPSPLPLEDVLVAAAEKRAEASEARERKLVEACKPLAEIALVKELYEGPPCNCQRFPDSMQVISAEHGDTVAIVTLGDCRKAAEVIAESEKVVNKIDYSKLSRQECAWPDEPCEKT